MPTPISATSGWDLLLSTAPLPSNLPDRPLPNLRPRAKHLAPATLTISRLGGGLWMLLNQATRPTLKHLPYPTP